MNFDRLRFVAERAEVGEEREALFAVTIPEERGSFKRFCELIGELPGGARSVTEFNYRISDNAKPRLRGPDHAWPRRESPRSPPALGKHGFSTLDLTHDELAKGNTSGTWWVATRRWPRTSGCCALCFPSAPAPCSNS